MFPIFLTELRPLFFRHSLWSDKDESFKAVFDVLTPHANSLIIRFLDRVKLLEARHLVEARIAMKSSSLHTYARKEERLESSKITSANIGGFQWTCYDCKWESGRSDRSQSAYHRRGLIRHYRMDLLGLF